MFIKVKGENDEPVLVNIYQIKLVAPKKFKGGEGCFIDLGTELYIRSNSTIAEVEKLIDERRENEKQKMP